MAIATAQYRDERHEESQLGARPRPLKQLRIPEQPTTKSIPEPREIHPATPKGFCDCRFKIDQRITKAQVLPCNRLRKYGRVYRLPHKMDIQMYAFPP